MSQFNVNEIFDKDGNDGAVLHGVASAPGGMNFRNRIINGDMRIDQRNAGAAVTASGDYPVDRFIMNNSTDGAFSAQQDSSAPAGFVKSIKLTTTTQDASLTGTQNYNVQYRIEGTDVADLGWGTADAKTVTLSFWVRSSLTGTFGGSLRNSVPDRSYPFTYTISVADTWEYKTVTVAGDTSGTWLTTTGIGLRVDFGLGTGPDRSGTAGAWASANYASATGAVSVIGTLNATWFVTGVQLEVGSVATPFERRPYGAELALCQRYFSSSFGVGTAPSGGQNYVTNAVAGGIGGSYAPNAAYLEPIKFPVSMRTTPTLTIYNTNLEATANRWQYFNGSSWVSFTATGPQCMNQDYFNCAVSGSWAANVNYVWIGSWSASAEL